MMMTQAASKSAGGDTELSRAGRPPLMPFSHPWNAGAMPGGEQARLQAGQNLLANSLSARLRTSSGTQTTVSASPARKEGRVPLSRSGKAASGAVEPLVEQETVKRKEYTRQWAQSLQVPTNVLPAALPADSLPRLDQSSSFEKSPKLALRALYFADGSFTSDPLSPIFGVNSSENRNYIKMVKRSGVFQPLDKYATPRLRLKGRNRALSARDSEYELLPFPFPDDDDDDDGETGAHGDRKRKGMKVSWSSMAAPDRFPELERKDSAYFGTSEATERRSTSTSQRSHFVTRKQKIEGVGVKWKLPQGYHNQYTMQKRIKGGNVCRDLHPVTSGMEREGTSVRKTRWQVASSMGSVDTSQSWLDKLESMKRSPSLYKDMTSRSGSHHHDDMTTPGKFQGDAATAHTRRSRVSSS